MPKREQHRTRRSWRRNQIVVDRNSFVSELRDVFFDHHAASLNNLNPTSP